MTWISIDAGVSGTGVVVWKDVYDNNEKSLPVKTFSLSYKTKNEYMEAISNICLEYRITECFCEDAKYFQGDVRGEVTATSGKLVKLARFIGGIEEVCRRLGINITLVPVVQWKGQLPKRITTSRVLKIWPDCPYNPDKPSHSHVFDALGIGFWKLKLF